MTEETKIKMQVKDYLKIRGVFCYHNLQGIGAYKGLPDLVIHHKGQVHYLEIKRAKGKLSPYQIKLQEQCETDSIPYHVIRSVEDIMALGI